MYNGHICGNHQPVNESPGLPDIAALINRQIIKVYLEKLNAGQLDADTWRHNTEQLWQAVQKGWEKAPQYFDKAQLTLLELRRNVNTFAAFKNHANVIELTGLLTGPDGEKLSFSKFKKLAQPVAEKYNINWLKAEYDYATKSARAAAEWDRFRQRGGKLEYITIGDGRVREAHRQLEGTILPVTHEFWKLYYPPNGWNCRCFVRWRPDSYNDVQPAAVPDVKEMFLNNVGMTGQMFTDAHPFIREIGAFQTERIREIAQQATTRFERQYIANVLKQNLLNKTTEVLLSGSTVKVKYSARRLSEALSQPHIQHFEKNRALLNIESMLEQATYVSTAPNVKPHKNRVKQYHYLLTSIEQQPSYLVLEELNNGDVYFYTIVERIK